MTTIISIEDYRQIVHLQSEQNRLYSKIMYKRNLAQSEILEAHEHFETCNKQLMEIGNRFGLEMAIENHHALVKGRYLLTDYLQLSDADHKICYTEKIYSVWDRKSARHNWNIICHAESPERQKFIVETQLDLMRRDKRFENGQVAIWDYEYYYKEMKERPYNLPKNHPMTEIYNVAQETEHA